MVCLELASQFAASLVVAEDGIGRRTGGGVAFGFRAGWGVRIPGLFGMYDLLRISRFWMSGAVEGLAGALVI